MSPMSTSKATDSEPHILAQDVSVDFTHAGQRNRVLNNISLEVPRGGFVSLIGPSGCGKSTLLKVLAGLLPPTEGNVQVAGMTPQQATEQRRIGLVFQEATLMPWKNALDNVKLLMQIAYRDRSDKEITERAREMLNIVGLSHALEKRPSQLSGGMRQRVAIARALALDPEVLMMDEPFGALDAITREEMSDFLLGLWQKTGKTVVLVTHSIDEAIFLSQDVHVMTTNPARILESVHIDIPYPRDDSTYSHPVFGAATTHLRRLLKDGHSRRAAA